MAFRVWKATGWWFTHNQAVPVWGIVNQKGGVGKTTTAVNLAAALSRRGQRVLLVDGDPQGNATTGLGAEKSKLRRTLLDVLFEIVDRPDDRDVVRSAILAMRPNLDLLPSTLDLAGAEAGLLNAVGKELLLRDAIAHVREDYDWILLDAPPSLGLLTINILVASDKLLVPMQCEFYAMEGVSQLVKTVELVKRRLNPSLEIGKVVLTMHDPRNRSNQEVAAELNGYFGARVSKVVIPRNVRLSEAPSYGEAAVEAFPGSKGALAYAGLTEEVLSECVAA
ncbi:MAG: Sporulation initiation inhibitor protein Soj [Fimbriimonadaceae bacterium]|nr:Sporulation initiation inhibitor protein Soj [Fimbriimonadaceae bacterium]